MKASLLQLLSLFPTSVRNDNQTKLTGLSQWPTPLSEKGLDPVPTPTFASPRSDLDFSHALKQHSLLTLHAINHATSGVIPAIANTAELPHELISERDSLKALSD